MVKIQTDSNRNKVVVIDTIIFMGKGNIKWDQVLVRHDENGKMYLYDFIDIKKETGNPLGL